MAQILINPVQRVDGATVQEISIGEKSIKTVQTIPKFQIKSDLELFEETLNTIPNFSDFRGIVLDLWSLPTVSPIFTLESGQRRLDDLDFAVSPIKKMLNDRILLIDPNTEWLFYKKPYKTIKRGGKTYNHYRHTELLNQRGFPNSIRTLFETHGVNGNDNKAWKMIDDENLLLSLSMWYVDQNLKYGADIIVPPAPLVDGRNKRMLEILVKINRYVKEYAFPATNIFWAFYIPIHPDAFKEQIRCEKILRVIRDNIMPNSIIIFKFFQLDNVLNNSVYRTRFSRFLSTVDNIKKSLRDNLAVIVFDTREEGLALMANGVDIVCDPLGGIDHYIQFSKKRNSDIGDSDDGGKGPLKLYGKYFDPGSREFISISDLIEMVKPAGIPPHTCTFCDTLQGKLINEPVSATIKMNNWNRGRRLHNFICRREEDAWLQQAILENNNQAVSIYLNQPERGNKNLRDLLPQSIFDM